MGAAEHSPGPVRVSAALLLELLGALNQDGRLRELLRGAPVLGLSVVLSESGPTVELSPAVSLTAAERSEARAIVDGIIAAVGQNGRGSRPSSEAGPRPHALAARRHLDAGDAEKALQVAEEALVRWPESADLHAYRALALSDLGELSRAAEAFAQLIRRDPRSVFAHASAAQLLARLGRWKAALAYARSALALDPDDVASLQVLALANEHLGAYRQAAEAMARALELDPTVPNGAEDLAEQVLGDDFEVDLVQTPGPEPTPPEPQAMGEEAGGPKELDLAESRGPAEDAALQLDPTPAEARNAADQAGGHAEPLESPDALLPPPIQHIVTRRGGAWGRASRPRGDIASVSCPRCGRENPARVSFCIGCGEPLK